MPLTPDQPANRDSKAKFDKWVKAATEERQLDVTHTAVDSDPASAPAPPPSPVLSPPPAGWADTPPIQGSTALADPLQLKRLEDERNQIAQCWVFAQEETAKAEAQNKELDLALRSMVVACTLFLLHACHFERSLCPPISAQCQLCILYSQASD